METTPFCVPMEQAIDFGSEFVVPQKMVLLAEAYRRDWEDLCASTSTPGKQPKKSLQQLIVMATDLSSELDLLVDDLSKTLQDQQSKDDYVARVNKIYRRLSTYPQFLPNFVLVRATSTQLPYMKFPYVRASGWWFRMHTILGDAEDQTFLSSLIPVFDWELPPWAESVGDSVNGFCVHFGRFDWSGNFSSFREVADKLRKGPYQKRAEQFERSFFAAFDITDQHRVVCTCADPRRYQADLKEVIAYAGAKPRLAKWLEPLRVSATAVRAGELSRLHRFDAGLCRPR
jgi:hypothetical protein